jgi:xanthine dehydrogenase YagS FAD-binding subunit
MKPFQYEQAVSVNDAVTSVAGRSGAVYLAGGTNLVDHLKLGVAAPDVLVDISALPLDTIQATEDGGLRIGAAVRNSDLGSNHAVRRHYPALSQALLAGASGQIRNAATTGGNLLQRTRCVYFQDVTTPCNKREPGSGCPAREGFHRNLAVLGASEHCVATHPSDMAVAMLALDATVAVLGADGERTVPIAELHRLPGDHPEQDTTLAQGDLITHIQLPAPLTRRSAYRKVRDRASYAFALVSVAAVLDVEDGVVRDVRIALGGVAHRPWRATTAEDLLRGRPATEQSFRAAATAELEEAEPLRDNAFKVPLVRNTITATLRGLAGGTR